MTRGLILGVALALSACALDPQGGYQPMQRSGTGTGSVTFNDANAQCWTVSMNNAGYGATMAQLAAYNTCMARNGWEDRRQLF